VERAVEHAQQRLVLGYDLGQVIAEYGALRIVLIEELKEAAAEIPLGAGFRSRGQSNDRSVTPPADSSARASARSGRSSAYRRM
jgi:hypothetical protein